VTALRVLIADDEPLARDGLRLLLEREPDLQVVAECSDGKAALHEMERTRPDVAFLDIRMPGASGLQVVSSLPRDERPMIVFVTAYDRHAVAAFDLAAVDYVLKPIDEERFAETIERLRRLRAAPRETRDERLESVLAMLKRLPVASAQAEGGSGYLERVTVRIGESLSVVPVADIDWIEAERDYMRLHVGTRSALLRMSLAELEQRLDPRRFLRVHRSSIVNVRSVQSLEPYLRGEWLLVLRSGVRVKLGRSHRDAVMSALGAR